MARLRSHGIVRESAELAEESHGPWYYEQTELGFNYRLTDLQAALGHSQLQRLDTFIAARRRLADRYDRLLADLPVITPRRAPERESAWHLYPVRVAAEKRRAVFENLRSQKIGVQVHYIPVHLQPDYRRLGFTAGDFPEAEAYYRQAFSLPLYADLSDADQDYVVAALQQALA